MRLVRVHQHHLTQYEPRREQVRKRAQVHRVRPDRERDPQRVLHRLVRERLALRAPAQMLGKVLDEGANVLEGGVSTHVRRARGRGRHRARVCDETTRDGTRSRGRAANRNVGL